MRGIAYSCNWYRRRSIQQRMVHFLLRPGREGHRVVMLGRIAQKTWDLGTDHVLHSDSCLLPAVARAKSRLACQGFFCNKRCSIPRMHAVQRPSNTCSLLGCFPLWWRWYFRVIALALRMLLLHIVAGSGICCPGAFGSAFAPLPAPLSMQHTVRKG